MAVSVSIRAIVSPCKTAFLVVSDDCASMMWQPLLKDFA